MFQVVEFAAQVDTVGEDSTMVARLVPFGEAVEYGAGTVQFAAGGITVGDLVPLTIDHGPSVSDRIGVMVRSFETDTGLYGEFRISHTPKGQEIRTLLADGALTDVSVGIEVSMAEHGRDETMTGALDHVSVVTHGRFGRTDHPSKVLAVHNEGNPVMGETVDMETAPVVVEYDDSEVRETLSEFKAELVRLADAADQADGDKVAQFKADDIFAAMVMKGAGLDISNHALADVVGDLGTADASGIVPDAYWAAGLQHKVDRRRPLFATAGSAPFPASGNNLELPKVTQEVAVSTRAAEKGAANSQALQAVMQTYPLQWFDGAVDIALEIISQSDPSVLSVVTSSMLTQYAVAVEADATTRLAGAATHTGAALDTATYAGLVGDLITTSDLIEDATGAPGDICGVTPAQWIAIQSLMDGGDRRQFAMINPQNADGSGSLVTRGIDIGGIFVYRAPAATAAIQYNQDSFKAAEKTPMQVAATNVELMGRDVGILGATVVVHWAEGVYSYEIV